LHLLTSGVSQRSLEGNAIITQLQAHVPAGDFLLVGGDFNTSTRTEAVLGTLGARVVTADPQPADQAGKQGTNAGRDKPYDWVLASQCLNVLQTPVVVGQQAYPNGLIVDTRVYSPMADLAPAIATDSAATNMQHMAILKAFSFEP
jgi:hypothetical protein